MKMNKNVDYHKLIKQLKEANIKEYGLKNFKDYLLTDVEWKVQKSKRERALKRTYIVVYSTFKKRLLARTFYLEEGFSQKQPYTFLTEVERQLAGCPYILTKRLYTMMGSQGYRVWKGEDTKGWVINNQGSHEIYAILYNWTGETYSYVQTYNDYLPFLKKSIHKYSAYELIPDDEKDNNYMFSYLLKYEKHPQIEMLVKLGLFHIMKEDLRYIRWSKKGPEMLGVGKQELKYLQSGIQLSDYRKVRDIVLKHHLSEDEAKKAIEFNGWSELNARMIRYTCENNVSARDYVDYIDFLNQLGVPMQPRNMYPMNFKEEHDLRMKEVNDHKDELMDKEIALYAEDLEKVALNKGGFVIVPAHSQNELINESKVLDHCVRTYAEKVSKRQTAIFFIRKEERVDEPFVTLELKDKKVMQCRAKKNTKPTDDVIDFVNMWCSKYHFKSCFGR